MPAKVRLARPGDAGFLAETWRAMSLESEIVPRGLVPDWRERLVACFRTGIEDGSQGWFVAEQSGLLVGSAAALLRASSLAAILHRRPAVLAGVYVLPAFRRQGLARELVLRAIAWSRERGCTHLSLHATAAAEPLYRELGFEDERAMVLNLP